MQRDILVDAGKGEGKLHGDWPLTPERAIVVEDGNAIGDGDEVLSRRIGDAPDVAKDDSLVRVVIPAWQGVRRLDWREPLCVRRVERDQGSEHDEPDGS